MRMWLRMRRRYRPVCDVAATIHVGRNTVTLLRVLRVPGHSLAPSILFCGHDLLHIMSHNFIKFENNIRNVSRYLYGGGDTWELKPPQT